LDKGVIVARGKHEELMEESELYAEIYNSQLMGDAEMTDDGRRETKAWSAGRSAVLEVR
jgi:hypothetical protein